MNRPGIIHTTYISGQGRAIGSQSAVFRYLTYTPGTFDGTIVETTLSPEVRVALDGYTLNTISLTNASTLAGTDSRFFDTFTLTIQKILQDVGGGSFVEFSNPTDPNAPILEQSFPLALRTFDGRQSTVQVYIDDAMVSHDGVSLNFDQALFELVNFDPTDNRFNGFLSDYLRFDLSAMGTSARPNLISAQGAGATAEAAFFSGDAISLSATVGPDKVYEVLTPLGHIAGTWRNPTSQTPEFGTYTLLEADPRILPIPNAARITALQGIWRNYTEMFLNLGSFQMIALPNTEDSGNQDIVILQRNGGGQIVNMYFGFVNYTSGTFSAFPIDQVDDGDASNELVGVVDGFINASGATVSSGTPSRIRGGNFTFASSPLPSGFPASGQFVVFRR